MNTRRKLIVAVGASALAAPFTSVAQQQTKVWRVGFLASRHVDFVDTDYFYGPFRQEMRERGYVEGRNLTIEWRSAEGNNERLPGLATELVNLKVDVIVATGSTTITVVRKATTTIPIVMIGAGDPVGSGFVKSLARPAGNVTGVSNMAGETRLKQLEMLLEMVPTVSRVAVLTHPDSSGNVKTLEIVEAAGRKRGVTIVRAEARTPQEIEKAFSLMRREHAGALIVSREALFQSQKGQIAELTARYRLPSMASDRIYAEAGCLMSYGTSLAGISRHAASYVDRILKGAKPADLPVEQPTRFEMVINGKTAKALGLTIPQSLLISADKVIE